MSSLSYGVKELLGLEGQASGLAQDLQKVQETWGKGTQNVNALGLDEAEKALTSTLDAWNQEFGVYLSILHQLAEKLHESARNNANAGLATLAAVHKIPEA